MTASILVLSVLVISKIAYDDVRTRTVKHRYLLCLAVLVLSLWLNCPNFAVLPYSFLILLVGFVLHVFRLLGAGDTKLLFVISLGVAPNYLPLLFFGIGIFSAVLVSVYLVVAVIKGMSYVKNKGLPFAIPISCSGVFVMFVSNCS